MKSCNKVHDISPCHGEPAPRIVRETAPARTGRLVVAPGRSFRYRYGRDRPRFSILVSRSRVSFSRRDGRLRVVQIRTARRFAFAFSPPAPQQHSAPSKQLRHLKDRWQLPKVGLASLSLRLSPGSIVSSAAATWPPRLRSPSQGRRY